MQPGHEEVALASKEEELLAELLDESSSFAQEMMVRLKRNRERIMSICLIRFLIGYFRKTLHISKYERFYKNRGFLLGGIICDSYYLTFCDSFVIVKLPPDIFYSSPSVSHRQ